MIVKMKRVLMLNAGYIEERPITIMKELGCYVITTGNRPDLPGHLLADKYVYGDFSDKDEMLRIAEQEGEEAICACCNDMSVKTASYVAEILGLPGQDRYRSSCIINNKDEFKKYALESGKITTAKGECFAQKERALEYAETAKTFPLIVKPVDLDSGKGVKRANTKQELIIAINDAFEKSISGHVVIEEFIDGTQHGFTVFLKDRKAVAVSSDNEISFINPYRVEVATWPATCYYEVRDQLIEEIEYMAESLDLADGIFHLQFIYRNGKAYILECMRRLIGNLCNRAFQIHDDFDWDYWYVRACCGFGCEDIPIRLDPLVYVGVRSLLAGSGGRFKGVKIEDGLKKHLVFQRDLLTQGEIIRRPFFDPISLLHFSFDSANEMEKMMVDRYSDISVITE